MPINISWKLNVQIQSGPTLAIGNTLQVDAFDRIELTVPDTTATPTATTVNVQPGAVGKVSFLLIRSNRYGDNLKYRVHDATTAQRSLNDAIFLVGAGGLDLMEDPLVPLDQLLVTNTTGQPAVIEIIVGRKAT